MVQLLTAARVLGSDAQVAIFTGPDEHEEYLRTAADILGVDSQKSVGTYSSLFTSTAMWLHDGDGAQVNVNITGRKPAASP